MNFVISKTWDGEAVDHDPVRIELQPDSDSGCCLHVVAPFFSDPPSPAGSPGQPFPCLWDYEVVEAFFLNDKEEYLEVELCPHGQHLVLLLKGRENIVQEQLPLEFSVRIENNIWHGETTLPLSYFPPCVSKFNAFAIHGSKEKRVYEALYPVKQGKFTEPNFHRLEYFQHFDMKSLITSNWTDYNSSVWSEHIS
ncbi:UPF0462 protein C4orf33 homolog isoform X2 [Gigantopelta aegis]|uniref:UPF0462 protein C4orf33 homolog isoform X2 n=1 Tax=Gigantopelta aegis TaxID=1735272 RepID=UPI001B8876B5|nr:UPF0462 protein C4orf33 homolog isoform X2 [Gigantopelta aegis]